MALYSGPLPFRLTSCCLLLMSLGCRPSTQSTPLVTLVDGSWRTLCIEREGPLASTRIGIDFIGADTVVRREEMFADTACTEVAGEVLNEGRYELEVTRSEADYKINMIFDRITARALSEVGQRLWNEQELCGIAAWPLGEPQDIGTQLLPGCPAPGSMPLKNWNLIRLKRGVSLEFAGDLVQEGIRPQSFDEAAPERSFLWSTSAALARSVGLF